MISSFITFLAYARLLFIHSSYPSRKRLLCLQTDLYYKSISKVKNRQPKRGCLPANGIFGFRHYPCLPTVIFIIFIHSNSYPYKNCTLSYNSFQFSGSIFILYISNLVFEISFSSSLDNKSASFCGNIFFNAYNLE